MSRIPACVPSAVREGAELLEAVPFPVLSEVLHQRLPRGGTRTFYFFQSSLLLGLRKGKKGAPGNATREGTGAVVHGRRGVLR